MVIILTIPDSEEHVCEKILDNLIDCLSLELVSVPNEETVLTFPSLEIHIHEQLVYRDRILIPMSHHEFFTLLYLAEHPNWVFSKEQIYKAVWKESGDGGAAVTNVISQIRRKIGDGYIKTVIGSGYKFEA